MRPAITKRLNIPDRVLFWFSARGCFFEFFGEFVDDIGFSYHHLHPDSTLFFIFLGVAS